MWNAAHKICLITGGTSGIGLQTAIALCKKEAIVVITYRNKEKEIVAQKIIKEATGKEIDSMYCDFASLDSVRKFVALFQHKYDKLHVLINNAGLWETERKLSKDGIEIHFAVNFLAPFLLTNLLINQIKVSSPARIINVSSGAHHQAKIHFNDIEFTHKFRSFQAYAQSKLATILFTIRLAQTLKTTGVTVNSLHPGVVSTNIFDNMNKVARWLFKPFLISAKKGAETSVFLATRNEVSDYTGMYFAKKNLKKPSKLSQNLQTAEQLWKLAEKYVQQKF